MDAHDVTEDFILYVMRSQEAIMFHEVITGLVSPHGHLLILRLQILHHIEEKTVKALLKQQYDASDVLAFNGTCKIGDVTFDKVADTSNEVLSVYRLRRGVADHRCSKTQ